MASQNRSMKCPSDIHKMGSLRNNSSQESDENTRSIHRGSAPRSPDPSKKFMSPTIASASKKKILAERNQDDLLWITPNTSFNATPHRTFSARHQKPSPAGPYDPINNYLSPRPLFLRYNPSRRQELLLRMEGVVGDEEEEEEEEEGSGDEDASPSSEDPPSRKTAAEEIMDDDTDSDDGEDSQIEDLEGRYWCSSLACKLLLLIGVVVFSTCYISSMNFAPAPQDYEDPGLLPPIAGNVSMFPGVKFESQAYSANTSLAFNARGLAHRDDAIRVDPVKNLVLEEMELQDKVLDTVNDRILDDVLISNEITGGMGLEENESIDAIEFVAGGDGEAPLVDNESVKEGFLIEGKNGEEVLDSHELLVGEQCDQIRTGGAVAEAGNVAIVSHIYENLVLDPLGSSQNETDSVEVKEVSEMSQFHRLHTTHSIQSDDDDRETFVFYRELQMCLLYGLVSVTAILGLLVSLIKNLLKYSQRSKPVDVLCSGSDNKGKSQIENDVGKPIPSMDLSRALFGVDRTPISEHGSLEMRLDKLPFSRVNEEELYASRPPTVELLAGKTVHGRSSAQKLEGNGAEELKLAPSEMRTASRKGNISFSAGKVYPTSSAESLSIGSFTPKERTLKKEDTKRGDLAATVPTTPLRRSSRIKSKETS